MKDSAGCDVRVAIVTGGARGIGAAISRKLAGDGFAVVVNYANSHQAADELLSEIRSQGGQAAAAQADIAAPDAMKALFDFAEKEFGGVDALVNNAGLMTLSRFAEATDEQFETLIAVNVGAAFRGMREAARRLRTNGRVINLSSSVVGLYQPSYGLYAATKSAVEAMTHVLAKELAARGGTANAVAPGPVGTDLFTADKTPAQIEAIARMNPFGRLGQPDDIARVVAWLAGPDSGWVNGQTIRANGGVL